jgi:hypothetical protein
MSDSAPADYSDIDVYVKTGIAGATVTTTAHYKTTDTTHSGVADGSGNADIVYRISRATPGFTVNVDVTVSGAATETCTTSFTPHA